MTALEGTPVRRIVAAIADAAERWADADFPPRVRLLDGIVERTGYTLPVIEFALDRLFFSITKSALEATIESELGSLDILDGFRPRTGRPDALARAAGNACIISSRTTIGVAIVPAVFALCAKCDVVVKDREDGLVHAFFTTLAEELDAFGAAAQARTWAGEGNDSDLAAYDVVVAFGSDETLTRIRERIAPAATFAGFCSKASLGYVGRDALTTDALAAIAGGAARDLVLYETEGCMSLHALFVERGGAVTTGDFATAISAAVERASVEFPRGKRDANAHAGVASARNLAAFRSAGGAGSVYSGDDATSLVVLDPPVTEAPLFLPRTLAVYSVDSPNDALEYTRAHRLPVEAIALAGTRDDIVNMALDMGANRITAFGELQQPPLAGGHGGRQRIADFVRWVTREG